MGAQRIFAAAFESQKILEEEWKQNIKLICKMQKQNWWKHRLAVLLSGHFAGLMLMINAGLMAIASSVVNREKYPFGALSLTMSHSHTATVAKGAFYFHKGDWCLWGRGPELEQGTSLSGTGHPFHTPNTSMVMNLWGKAKVNELRPTWPLRGENEGKGVGGKKDGDSRTAR